MNKRTPLQTSLRPRLPSLFTAMTVVYCKSSVLTDVATGREAGMWAAEGDGSWAASLLQTCAAMPRQVPLFICHRRLFKMMAHYIHLVVRQRESWTHFMMFQVLLSSSVSPLRLYTPELWLLKPRLSKKLSDFNHLMLGETPLLAAEPLQKVQFVECWEYSEIDIKLALRIKPRPSMQFGCGCELIFFGVFVFV